MSADPQGTPPVSGLRRLRAWLEIARISNLPTVLSNGIAGATLGACAVGIDRSFEQGMLVWWGGIVAPAGLASAEVGPLDDLGSATRFLGPLIVPVLAYVGGMILNDAFDAEVDARERPSRPIPSGRISRRAAFGVGFGLLAGALALAGISGAGTMVAATGVLCAAIVVYDRFHLATSASTLLLALCRALAALIPMLAFADGDLEVLVRRGAIMLPAALAAWTLGLSLLARNEASLRSELLRRATPDEAPQPCPGCGQLNLADALACTECGRVSSARERGVTAWYGRRSHARLLDLAPVGAVILLVLGFGLVHDRILQRGRLPGETMVDELPAASLACGALLVVFLLRARRMMRADPSRTPDAVAMLIACLALVDVLALTTGGHWLPALACGALFGATRGLQRLIAGS